jgi:hypothetical protein
MPLDMTGTDEAIAKAVMHFWASRRRSAKRKKPKGKVQGGARGAVLGGKNMDGFLDVIGKVVRQNGLPEARIFTSGDDLVLPGYYRPTKMWDVLVFSGKTLIAALELKSQVGSFGNNFNNRTEEALGTAHDLQTALRESQWGEDSPPPFLGWAMLLEDSPKSLKPVREAAPHFPVDDVFDNASYAKRYHVLCQRMMSERLYDGAALMLSAQSTGLATGACRAFDPATGIDVLLARLAGHVAAFAHAFPKTLRNTEG